MFHRLLILVIAAQVVLFCGCAKKSYLPEDAEFDERFVGIWRGELEVENSDNLRRWKKKRRPDGALVINIGLYDKDMTYLGREVLSGFWWVQEKMYYEKLPGLNDLVVPHEYEVQEDGSLKFTVRTAEGAKREYSFTEAKAGKKD